MTPSPETCKRLTEYLGECWHEPIGTRVSEWHGPLTKCSCGMVECPKVNLLFSTSADLFTVYGKMVERGEWLEFIDWIDETQDIPLEQNGDGHAWLFCLAAPDQIGERMEMASAWLKERGK